MLSVIYVLYLLSDCKYSFANDSVNFVSLQQAAECSTENTEREEHLKLPKCSFSVSKSITDFKTECIKPGIVRIQGEYGVLKIICEAKYAIDLDYLGIQPTEGLNVTWSKGVEPKSFGKSITFKIEILVRSTTNLHDFYENHFKTSEGKFTKNLKTYTRTGQFIIRGIWNETKLWTTSYYLFLEDDFTQPSFLRNPKTKEVEVKEREIILPCLGSHFNANITVMKIWPKSYGHENYSEIGFEETKGIFIPISQNLDYHGRYKCILQHNNFTDELQFTIPAPKTKGSNVPYGMEEFGSLISGDVEINYKSRIDNHSVIHIEPYCRVMNLNEPNTMLNAVPAHNFGYLRLVREFVLPKYMNMSYTLRRGTERAELEREIRITENNSLTRRFGVTFCQSGNEHKIIEYGTSQINGEIVKISYGLDWTFLPRDQSDINIFYILKLKNVEDETVLYANSSQTFSCRIHDATVVKPIIWYTERRNGSIVEEYIDYNWVGSFSFFTKNITLDMVKVYCSGSFWYSSSWRNISIPINVTEAQLPVITTEAVVLKFRPNFQNQILKCEAEGKPTPKIYWHYNGFDISANAVQTETSSILDFPQIDKRQAGDYVCVAINEFGKAEKIFTVDVQNEPGFNYGESIGIPAAILVVTAVIVYLYIRHWKQKQKGLTKQEIEEFIKGHEYKSRSPSIHDYAHDFANYVPYTGEHEIHTSKFQVDESCVLGSGAYGIVYKGLLDGVTVAVKTVKRNADKSYLKALLSELKIMLYLGSHPNVIDCLGSNTSALNKGIVYIFVTYCTLGSLQTFLEKNRRNYIHYAKVGKVQNTYCPLDYVRMGEDNNFDCKTLLTWAHQIAQGMQYLSEKKVIHGDLAARNVLLNEDKQAKISDFGLSRQLVDYTDYVKKNQEPLPWRWLAIESLKDMSFSSQSDVWAYGITMWEIYTLGKIPYPGYTWNVQFIEELEGGMRMKCPKLASNLFYEVVISECWRAVPSERLTFKTICDKFENTNFFVQDINNDQCDYFQGKNDESEDISNSQWGSVEGNYCGDWENESSVTTSV